MPTEKKPLPFQGLPPSGLSRRIRDIEAITDEAIDTSDIPEAGEEFFKRAKLRKPINQARPNGAGRSANCASASGPAASVPPMKTTTLAEAEKRKRSPKGTFDRKAYQRELMRKRRAKK